MSWMGAQLLGVTRGIREKHLPAKRTGAVVVGAVVGATASRAYGGEIARGQFEKLRGCARMVRSAQRT